MATTVRFAPGAEPAAAAVVHGTGFHATVAGSTSWYGSYEMGDLGTAWCIDHGIRAPDPDLGYIPTDVTDQTPGGRTAMAWALARHGSDRDAVSPVDAAALMLVMHDLMGARYPGGPIDVDGLGPGELAGFAGAESAVLDRARAMKADALARRHLVGPLALTVEAVGVDPDQRGEAVVRLVDAAGAAVPGMAVSVTATGARLDGGSLVTGADGTARAVFTAGEGDNRFTARATVPDLSLQAFAPVARPAQRVARPALVEVAAEFSFTARRPATVSIRKVGDARSYLPVDGARFTVLAPDPAGAFTVVAGELVTGADGTSAALRLAPGRYRVLETGPPEGYWANGPWEVHLEPGAQVTMEASNAARRGSIRVTKVDAEGRPLAGATLALRYDADADGVHETPLPAIVTGSEPAVVAGVLPGRYRLDEIAPPPGYLATTEPVMVTVSGDTTVDVELVNRRRPALVGIKTDAETGAPLARAEYDLYREAPEGPQWVARAASGSDGVVAWGPLDPGAVYCARERAAPSGYELDPEPVCTDGPLSLDPETVLALPDRRAPAPTTTTTTTTAPGAPARPPPASPRLPRTGASSAAWALVGTGLISSGLALVGAARRRLTACGGDR